MSRFRYKDCTITTRDQTVPKELPICLRGTLSGTTTARHILVSSSEFTCHSFAVDRRFEAWLPCPGTYSIYYSVFNNFSRHIRDVEIESSCELNIPYNPPSMTIRVLSLPQPIQGCMVYRRGKGGYSRRNVADFSEFRLDFEYEPDLFLENKNILGLVIGENEYQFPFSASGGDNLVLDFAQATVIPFVME